MCARVQHDKLMVTKCFHATDRIDKPLQSKKQQQKKKNIKLPSGLKSNLRKYETDEAITEWEIIGCNKTITASSDNGFILQMSTGKHSSFRCDS